MTHRFLATKLIYGEIWNDIKSSRPSAVGRSRKERNPFWGSRTPINAYTCE